MIKDWSLSKLNQKHIYRVWGGCALLHCGEKSGEEVDEGVREARQRRERRKSFYEWIVFSMWSHQKLRHNYLQLIIDLILILALRQIGDLSTVCPASCPMVAGISSSPPCDPHIVWVEEDRWKEIVVHISKYDYLQLLVRLNEHMCE